MTAKINKAPAKALISAEIPKNSKLIPQFNLIGSYSRP